MKFAVFLAIFTIVSLLTTVFAICPCSSKDTNDTLVIEKQVSPEVTEVRKEEVRAICGNGICEDGENQENCPQDCSSEIVAIPKKEFYEWACL